MQLNTSITPMKRKDAAGLLRARLQDSQRDGGESISFNPTELEGLYKYFMSPVPSKPKTMPQWVSKATPKNDVRLYLNYLYSDGTTLYGCDGHRIHWAPDTRPEGYYCPKSFHAIEHQGTYPDVERIIKQKRPDFLVCDTAQAVTKWAHGVENIEGAPGVWLNKLYLQQALAGATVFDMEYDAECRHTSVKGRSEFGEFVIMPIRDI